MPSTNGHGPKRAILYARVSTDEQARSGYFLVQQIEALRDYAAREGYEVLEEVVETPDRAAQAWRGLVWTVCGTSWQVGASLWCSHRTVIGSPVSPLTTIPPPPRVRGTRDEDTRPQ
jgi:resolvase-like protein